MVAKSVVDGLEIVEVYENQCQVRLITPGLGNCVLRSITE